MVWLAESPDQTRFDVAIVDFPDPSTYSVGKLYTTRLYRLLGDRMTDDGVVAVQSTSPLFARQSFWSVMNTLRAAGWAPRPYHVAVPSFGVWGYALARKRAFEPPQSAPPHLRFLDGQTMASLFVLPRDLDEVPAPTNRLDNQALVRLYESEWRRWE
jgi:spermidine synthase